LGHPLAAEDTGHKGEKKNPKPPLRSGQYIFLLSVWLTIFRIAGGLRKRKGEKGGEERKSEAFGRVYTTKNVLSRIYAKKEKEKRKRSFSRGSNHSGVLPE